MRLKCLSVQMLSHKDVPKCVPILTHGKEHQRCDGTADALLHRRRSGYNKRTGLNEFN